MAHPLCLICIEPLLLRALTRISMKNGSTSLDVDFAVQSILSSAYRSGARRTLCVLSHPAQPTRCTLLPRFHADIDRMSIQDTRALHDVVKALIAAGVPVTSQSDALALDLVWSASSTPGTTVCCLDPLVFQCQRDNLSVQPFFRRSIRGGRPWEQLPPALIPDYFALTGSSDSFPLVPAADASSALALLQKHGSLEAILREYSTAHFVKGRREELLVARQLMQPRKVTFNALSLAVSL